MLTSAGITNNTLARALKSLVNGKIRIAFIPTAANLEDGGKEWLIDNFNECQRLGPTDIVDIAAVPKGVWLPRLRAANVIFVGGGDTVYLMNQIIKSGLNKELPTLLKRKIYVGISAGSMVTQKRLTTSPVYLYGKEPNNVPPGLGYIDFHIRPHLNSPYFPRVRDKNLRKAAKYLKGDLYAIDDDSAVLCMDGKIRVVSEGKWKKY